MDDRFYRRTIKLIMEPITFRTEIPADHKSVFKIIEAAFQTIEISDHKEQFLVERLRKSDAFIPELSTVAELNDVIVGHILLTKIKIKNVNTSFDSLALAPVSVHPDFQNKGIGSALIKEAHKRSKALGFQSIILVGHADYYPRFGYELTSKYGIKLPFPAPEESCMIIELNENGLKDVSGTVEYSKPFFE